MRDSRSRRAPPHRGGGPAKDRLMTTIFRRRPTAAAPHCQRCRHGRRPRSWSPAAAAARRAGRRVRRPGRGGRRRGSGTASVALATEPRPDPCRRRGPDAYLFEADKGTTSACDGAARARGPPDHRGQADRPGGRGGRQARHREVGATDRPGDVQRAPALHLRRRQRSGPATGQESDGSAPSGTCCRPPAPRSRRASGPAQALLTSLAAALAAGLRRTGGPRAGGVRLWSGYARP